MKKILSSFKGCGRILAVVLVALSANSCMLLLASMLGGDSYGVPGYMPGAASYSDAPWLRPVDPSAYAPGSRVNTSPDWQTNPIYAAPVTGGSYNTSSSSSSSVSSSGSSASSSKDCRHCYGTGKCPRCVNGYRTEMGIGSGTHQCDACKGTGRCSVCGGSGKV